MFVIGLTGSIAMGKTTTARLFADEGVPVHDADAAVHKLYAGEAAGLIEAGFPGSTRNGTVDRVQLGKQVTGDPTALRRLEEIVHPLVRNAERKFLREAEIAGAPIVVLDVPLLFETGGDGRVDATVVVSAPAETRCQPGAARSIAGAANARRGKAAAGRFRGG
jgi:dephospho-CoA kinase